MKTQRVILSISITFIVGHNAVGGRSCYLFFLSFFKRKLVAQLACNQLDISGLFFVEEGLPRKRWLLPRRDPGQTTGVQKRYETKLSSDGIHCHFAFILVDIKRCFCAVLASWQRLIETGTGTGDK